MAKESFENNLEKLEKIISDLEKGDLSLDDSIKKFEEGINISNQCSKTLEEAEKKITILLNKDGEIEESDFLES